MKPSLTKSPTAKLETELAQHTNSLAAVDAETQAIITAKRELAGLDLTIDLLDEKALADFARREIVVRLGENDERGRQRSEKRRITERALIDACHDFIVTALLPRVKDLRHRTEKRLTAALKGSFSAQPHFDGLPDSPLSDAVNASEQGRELARLEYLAICRGDSSRERGARDFAQELLQAWKDVDAFEKTYLD